MTTNEEVDLTPFPEDLIRILRGLAALHGYAVKMWFESCSDETRELLLDGEYIQYNKKGKAIITDRTLALLSAAREWVREPETFDMAIQVALAERHGDPEFQQRVSAALERHAEILRSLEW